MNRQIQNASHQYILPSTTQTSYQSPAGNFYQSEPESVVFDAADIAHQIANQVRASLEGDFNVLLANQQKIAVALTHLQTSVEFLMQNLPKSGVLPASDETPSDETPSASGANQTPQITTVEDLNAFENALQDSIFRKRTERFWKDRMGTNVGTGKILVILFYLIFISFIFHLIFIFRERQKCCIHNG